MYKILHILLYCISIICIRGKKHKHKEIYKLTPGHFLRDGVEIQTQAYVTK